MAHHVRLYETGTPSVLRYEETQIGDPGPTQVRLRQEAIGVNFVDTMFRDGTIDVPRPFAIGVEGAGIVDAVGTDVSTMKVGDRVAYWFSFGSYANVRLIDADALVKLPKDISTEQAAAIFAKGVTAWMLLKRVHVVKPDEIILVQAAAGGVGSLVSTWAKALGATVIGTVGSPSKAATVREHGIDHVFTSDDPNLIARVKEISDGRGVDVVYELVGAATFAKSVAAVREGGELIRLGNASGSPSVDHTELDRRRIRYIQPSAGQYVKDRTSFETASFDLFAAFQSGVFGEVNITRYPLADAQRAHEDIGARRNAGSIILIPEYA